MKMTIKQARRIGFGAGRYAALTFGLSAAMVAGFAGCHGNSASASDQSGAVPVAQSGTDPAAANVASASGQPAQVLAQNEQYAPQQQGEDYAPAQVAPGYDNGQGNYADTDLTDEQANEAPPPLPEYDQPPAPDPDYIWTPGYWAWGPGGYYWVPGCWVAAPYADALWTPGYWGYYGGGYRFHHGYWGLHIGFYGGINYGFGYFGSGYEGGYWNGNHFYYNTAITHVNTSVRNVYVHNVTVNNSGRVSFNGGRGGIQARPGAAEVTAMHEQRMGPMQSQAAVQHEASQNRQQFYSANKGRPATTVAARPVVADRTLPAALPRAAEPARNGGAMQGPAHGAMQGPAHGPAQARPEVAQPMHTQGASQQGRNVPEAARPGQPQNEARPVQPHNEVQPQQHAMKPSAQVPQTRPQQQSRPQAEARPMQQERPTPAMRPAPQTARPQEQARPQAMPQHQAAPRPAPAPHPQAAPHPQGGAHPEPHGDDRSNH